MPVRVRKTRLKWIFGTVGCVAVAALHAFAAPAQAQGTVGDFIIYPKSGQSQEVQSSDQQACYEWSKQESGVDPMAAPTATTPPPEATAPQGGAVRGAARGALLGVAIGAIAGDAGKGAAIGAASGGTLGLMRRRRGATEQASQEQQWANQQATQIAQGRASYNQYFMTCMQGRDYTVNPKGP